MGVVDAMYEEARFKECLGKEENYPNYLAFFQREIDAYGVDVVLNQYVFYGDDRAESMLSRLFGGRWEIFLLNALILSMLRYELNDILQVFSTLSSISGMGSNSISQQ